LKRVLLFASIGLVASFLVMVEVVWRSAQGPAASPRPKAAPSGRAEAREPRPLRPVEVPFADRADFDRLRSRSLGLPVEGMNAAELRDNFGEDRGGHGHEALDILAPRGTRVLAVDDGRVVKLFKSAQGGLTVYQFDPTGTFCYYYAHLDAYAAGLEDGGELRKGSLIGYVGTTGNAPRDRPHLHFAVFKLGPQKHWSEGTPLNPFPLWVDKG
jgi:murein DD-endopeptidase MepM/ murein hydrolase activator NlpD